MSNLERNLIARVPRKIRYAGYALTLGALAMTACGGSKEVKAQQESTPNNLPTQPAATATIEAPTPTAIPTEAPKVIKAILDQPVVKSDIKSIKELTDSFFAKTWPESSQKLTIDRELNNCETGDNPPPGTNPKEIAAVRESGCFAAIKIIYGLYKIHGFDELRQIALGARNYFVTQYPERRDRFESNLRNQGIN